MRITYDRRADAIYIFLQPKNKHLPGIVTDRKGDYPINIEYMADDQIFGIEILEASKMVDLKNLKKLEFEQIG